MHLFRSRAVTMRGGDCRLSGPAGPIQTFASPTALGRERTGRFSAPTQTKRTLTLPSRPSGYGLIADIRITDSRLSPRGLHPRMIKSVIKSNKIRRERMMAG